MRIQTLDTFFEANALPPADPQTYRAWLNMDDALAFLGDSTTGDVPVLAILPRCFLYAVFVPRKRLVKGYVADLLRWNFNVSAGWGYGYKWNAAGEEEPFVGTLFDSTGTRILEGAEPLVFLRDIFDSSDSQYLELNQRVAHLLGVHRVEQKNAYCLVDEHGDLKSAVTLRTNPDNLLCTVTRDLLDFYMYLTDSVLVRVFEVNRYRRTPGYSDDPDEHPIHDAQCDLYARLVFLNTEGKEPASYLRGFQIVRNTRPPEEMRRRLRGEPAEGRQFVSFLANDFKHDEVRECSCNPEDLGNYFVPSGLPYSTSPAFFRPEVLLRYKQDPDKYAFRHRNITCRSTWSLDYDLNESGQVHAYLKDLAGLPYQEQLYWKAFNVPPEGGISERALRNDFKGEWYAVDDPLESLKQHLLQFPQAVQRGREVDIWTASEDARIRSFPGLTYVVTESAKEWEDQILALAKVVVEGIQKKPLAALAKELGADDKTVKESGSLRLLRLCLEQRDIEAGVIDACVKPLQEVQGFRSSRVAHAGGKLPTQDLRRHHRTLLEQCDLAMVTLADLVREGLFTIT